MSLLVGTVTIDDEGIVWGNGAAYALYVQLMAIPSIASTMALPESMPADRGPYCSYQVKLSLMRAQADLAIALASGLIPYLTANAAVTGAARVTTQSLGRTPNPNNANVAIQAPASPVDVPVTGLIS